jgi:hypothetical protein
MDAVQSYHEGQDSDLSINELIDLTLWKACAKGKHDPPTCNHRGCATIHGIVHFLQRQLRKAA